MPSGCGFLELEDDKLTSEKRLYVGDELRIDGLYYTVGQNMHGDLYTVYFFYRNGVVRYVGSSNDPEFLNEENRFGDGRAKYEWGLFNVEGDKIAFEKWYPASKGIAHSFIRSGKILNDTTFVITESRRSNGEEVREENEMYHFRPFSPKPDSTSRYID